jgi:hypothetical protein
MLHEVICTFKAICSPILKHYQPILLIKMVSNVLVIDQIWTKATLEISLQMEMNVSKVDPISEISIHVKFELFVQFT